MGCSNNETDKHETPPLRPTRRTEPRDKDWRFKAGHTTMDENGALVFTLFNMDELTKHKPCFFPFLREVLFVIYICEDETSNSDLISLLDVIC
jgi:hypothetical protein